MMNRTIIIFFFLFGLTVLAGAQQSGVIRGTVLDDEGKPVSDATVIAREITSNAGIEKSARSDGTGNFVIADLEWGKYTVSAEKPDAGYPLTPSAFYGPVGPPPILEITAKNVSASTQISFGSKMSSIVGTVVDDGASVPIPATFLIRHAQEPANALSVEQGSSYRILLPPGVQLTMEVSAQGYKTWYYPGTNDYKKKTTFVLSPGQTLPLDVRLDGEYSDCACLDRPPRWGLGPDSPVFQWQDLQDESSHRTCHRHHGQSILADLITSAQ